MGGEKMGFCVAATDGPVGAVVVLGVGDVNKPGYVVVVPATVVVVPEGLTVTDRPPSANLNNTRAAIPATPIEKPDHLTTLEPIIHSPDCVCQRKVDQPSR